MTLRRVLALVGARRPGWLIVGSVVAALAIIANVALVATSAYLVSRANVVTNVAELALTITAVRVLAIGRAVGRYIERVVIHAGTFRVLADLRAWCFASLEPLAPAGLRAWRGGDVLTRLLADVATLEQLFAGVIVPPIVAVAAVGFGCLLLAVIEPGAALLLLGAAIATGIVAPLIVRAVSRGPAHDRIRLRAEATAYALDQVRGMADLAALDRDASHRARLLDVASAMDRATGRLAMARAGHAIASSFLTGLAAVGTLAVGIAAVGAGTMPVVLLAVLPLAAIATFEAVGPLAAAVQRLDGAEAAGRRLFEVIDATPAVTDIADPLPAPDAHGIVVSGLRFRYPERERWVFDGLSLAIPAGGRLALVGPSGAGKSTLLALLLRFEAYAEGEIRIGGRELRELAADDVRGMLAVVTQRVDLFDATIRDNLALADPDLDDERAAHALETAQLADLVASLPGGDRTRIGEDGLRLSGGERRRLAIARAIVRDRPILVLDEPTADLDAATEARLWVALEPFLRGRTTLVLTHRPPPGWDPASIALLSGGLAGPGQVR